MIIKNNKETLKQNLLIEKIDRLKKSVKAMAKLDEDKFFEDLLIILDLYDTKFGFQNKNSKKHGHVKIKINKITGEKTKELKIEKNEIFAGQVYTVIHELTHLINKHIEEKLLTKKQAEVVADTVAIIFLKKYGLYEQYLISNVSKKWDVKNYANNYIKSMTFSKTKEQIIISQIQKTDLYFSEIF